MVSIALRITIPRVSPLATYSLSLRPLPSSRGRLVLFFTCTPSCLPPHGGLSIPPLDASAAAPRKQDTKGLLLNSTEPGIGVAGNK